MLYYRLMCVKQKSMKRESIKENITIDTPGHTDVAILPNNVFQLLC